VVRVKCRESGLWLEAKNKHVKRFEEIASLKRDAHRDGYYRPVCNTLFEVRKAGGYTNVAEYMELVHASLDKKLADNKAYRSMRQEEEKKRERKESQIASINALRKTNRVLCEHGFQWKYAEGPERTGWFLFSPDGRIVTVAEALAEIDGKEA
jgi:hypothetical protein